jgi:hypothetical protein
MASSKKASSLVPPPNPANYQPKSGEPEKTGQDYHERKAKGRKEYAFWLDSDRQAKVEALRVKLDQPFPKNVFERAIDDLYQRVMLGGGK